MFFFYISETNILKKGLFWPAASAMFVHWATPSEKSRLIGMAASGSYVGNVFALETGSYISNKHIKKVLKSNP